MLFAAIYSQGLVFAALLRPTQNDQHVHHNSDRNIETEQKINTFSRSSDKVDGTDRCAVFTITTFDSAASLEEEAFPRSSQALSSDPTFAFVKPICGNSENHGKDNIMIIIVHSIYMRCMMFLRRMLDVRLLTNIYVVLFNCVTIAMSLVQFSLYTFTPLRAKAEGLDMYEVSLMLSMVALGEIVGRVLLGIVLYIIISFMPS